MKEAKPGAAEVEAVDLGALCLSPCLRALNAHGRHPVAVHTVKTFWTKELSKFPHSIIDYSLFLTGSFVDCKGFLEIVEDLDHLGDEFGILVNKRQGGELGLSTEARSWGASGLPPKIPSILESMPF